MWIFGYGSLIWKVDFPVAERVPGVIRGYVRRFWQGSHDHRGVPGAPGRVVTLIPYDEWKGMTDEFRDEADSVTWGVAYRIPDDKVDEVKAHLDHREKDGYTVHEVDVFRSLKDDTPAVTRALCYMGTTQNESFHGHKPLDALAEQIYRARGPSGPNDEYLLNLAKAMRDLKPDAVDHHLFELERRVLALRKQFGPGGGPINGFAPGGIPGGDLGEEPEHLANGS
ncbi:hypothetical protein H9P43_002405 [Blastocladiella emersonii ATCC 22665]|nr:hypothetical protein H9P43_002405 [Blastocladiella emersonii ATCC 22665]